MIRLPPVSPLTDTLCPYPAPFRSLCSPLGSTSTGSVGLLGFQLNHSAERALRMVGRSRSSERWLRLWASSTHATSKPSSDLIESDVWFCIPWKMITPQIGIAHV